MRRNVATVGQRKNRLFMLICRGGSLDEDSDLIVVIPRSTIARSTGLFHLQFTYLFPRKSVDDRIGFRDLRY